MELLKNLEGLSADEQMSAVVELQKAAMKTLEDQKQASIGKSAELVIQGLKKIKSDFEAKFDSLNYDIQTKVASLKDGEQGLQGPKGEQGDRGLDGSNGRDGRDGKDGKDGLDGVDGVGVRDAKIDFDGSLVITLSDGREINVGEVVPVDVAEKIRTVHNIQSGSGGDSQTVLDAIAALQATIATYGTMATQNANNVAITGGTINNTTIGATTPSTGVFTTLTATGQTSLGGKSSDNTDVVRVYKNNTLSGGVASFTGPAFSFIPPQDNFGAAVIGLGLNPRINSTGTDGFWFATNQTVGFTGTIQARIAHTASAVNYVQVTGAATGGNPSIQTAGSDANRGLSISSKGTSAVGIYSGAGTYLQFQVVGTNSAVNYLQAIGTTAGNSPSFAVNGTDTNIDLTLTPKGTGSVVSSINGGTFTTARDSANNRVQLRSNGNLGLFAQSGGAVGFYTNTAGDVLQMQIAHTASAVNYVQVTGAATGGVPTISAQGSDSNVSLFLNAKGTGNVFLQVGGANVFQAAGSSTSVNRVLTQASNTGVAPVVQSVGSDTNIPLVLQPKGTGALQAQQTDSTATGGNARGANAVDWQTSRASASQVASATASNINGGANNSNASSYSTIGGGYGNTLGASNGTLICGGSTNSIGAYPSYYSTIVGGANNTANGWGNFIGGGQGNFGTSGSAVTTQSGTMNATTAVTLSGSNANIKVGQIVTGTSIANNTYVAAISGTSLTLSQAASGSSTSTLSFYTPHGVVVGGGNNQATGSYSFIGGGGDAGTAANRNVASGDWSFVGGGRGNTANGAIGAFVGGGFGHTASNVGSVVCGGGFFGATASSFVGNLSSGASSFIGAGYQNNSSGGFASAIVGGSGNSSGGNFAFVGAGNGNASNANQAAIMGGSYGLARSITGNHVFPACAEPIAPNSGVTQSALLLLGRQTTDATATVLTSNNVSANTTNQVILPNNSAYYFKGSVIANVTGAANGAAWSFEGAIMRGANAASTVLIGTPTVNRVAASAGATAWTIAITADTTNGGLAVTVTGAASTTIRWVAKMETTEVTF